MKVAAAFLIAIAAGLVAIAALQGYWNLAHDREQAARGMNIPMPDWESKDWNRPISAGPEYSLYQLTNEGATQIAIRGPPYPEPLKVSG